MATLVHQCPHCATKKIALRIVQVTYGQPTQPGEQSANYVHLSCSGCGRPSAAEVASESNDRLVAVETMMFDLDRMGWSVREFWPAPPSPRLPDHLPEAVAKAFLSAEWNFPQRDMEEASAGSYGRALDIGTKLIAPDLAGLTLHKRIETLADRGRITPELKAWAHEIRLIRNYALHEIESVERDELAAMRGAAELLLTYLFTLPGMLRQRRTAAGEQAKG